MNPRKTRRQFITGAAAVTSALVAGCSGSGGPSTPPSAGGSTSGSTPINSSSESSGREEYNGAIELLAKNKAKLDEWTDPEAPFNTGVVNSLYDRVSQARNLLNASAASADSNSRLADQIETARVIADFQSESILYYDNSLVASEAFFDGEEFGKKGDHSKAAKFYGAASEAAKKLRDNVDELVAVFSKINASVIDEPSLEYTGSAMDYINLEDPDGADAIFEYISGMESLQLALAKLNEGVGLYNDKNYTDALDVWETAKSHAEDTVISLESVIDNEYGLEIFRKKSERQIDDVKTVRDALDKMVNGANEAADGNVSEGDRLVDEAQKTVEETFN